MEFCMTEGSASPRSWGSGRDAPDRPPRHTHTAAHTISDTSLVHDATSSTSSCCSSYAPPQQPAPLTNVQSFDVCEHLRNPLHGLMALIEVLVRSPHVSQLPAEEQEWVKGIKLAANLMHNIVDGAVLLPVEAEVQAEERCASGCSGEVPLESSDERGIAHEFSQLSATGDNELSPPVPSACHQPETPTPIQTTTISQTDDEQLPPPLQTSPVRSIVEAVTKTSALEALPPTAILPVTSTVQRKGIEHLEEPVRSVSSLKVLIVDDMALNRKVLRKMLDNIEDVDVAGDGIDALNFVRARMEKSLNIKLPPFDVERIVAENVAALPQLFQDSPLLSAVTPLSTTAARTPASAPNTPSIMQRSDSSSASSPVIATPTAHKQSGVAHRFPTNFYLSPAEEKIDRLRSTPISTMQMEPQGYHLYPERGHQQTRSMGDETLRNTEHTGNIPNISALYQTTIPSSPAAAPVAFSRRHSMPTPLRTPLYPSVNLPTALLSPPALTDSTVQYDCIISDLQMPRCNGLQFIILLRELEREYGLPPAPMIAATSNTGQADRIECAKLDYTYFIAKPFSRKDIQGVLELIAHEKQQQQHSLAGLRRELLRKQQLEQIKLLQAWRAQQGSAACLSSSSESPPWQLPPSSLSLITPPNEPLIALHQPARARESGARETAQATEAAAQAAVTGEGTTSSFNVLSPDRIMSLAACPSATSPSTSAAGAATATSARESGRGGGNSGVATISHSLLSRLNAV